MLWPLVLSILGLASNVQGQKLAMQTCSKDMVYTDIGTNANTIIGGLYELRGPGTDGLGCGPFIREMMQVLEASRFTISALNIGAGYIPGVTFGMRVYDTCREKSVTLKALQELYPQTTANNPFCTQNNELILGTVGPLFSSTAVPAAMYASSIPASLISPRAASTSLSDKTRFPTFLRSVTSFASLGKATIELLKAMQWEQNILLVYSDDEYGRSGYKQLLQAAYNREICFAKAIAVDPINLTKDRAKATLAAIGSKTYGVGVIVMPFVEGKTVLEAIDEMPSLASTQWVISDFDITFRYGQLTRARGALLVTPDAPTVSAFKNWFVNRKTSLNPNDHPENPWFIDWYEEMYSCWIRTSRPGINQCAPLSQAAVEADFIQSPFAVPTMKAIAAYAEAVRQLCSRSGVQCVDQLRSIRPSDFLNTLKNLDVTFPSTFPIPEFRGQRIKFDANGNLESYDCVVYNFNSLTGTPEYDKVGELRNNIFRLNKQPNLYNAPRTISLGTNPTYPCPLPDGCTNCLKPEISTVFRYNPGDVVIASLASGHMTGRFPFTCGEGMSDRLAALVAAEWAVNRFKTDNPRKLRQVSLGSLVVDICPDGLVAGGFITDLLSGNNRLLGSSGNIVTADNIRGFVDHTDGYQARMISPVLAQYKLPEIQTDSVHANIMMQNHSSMGMMSKSDDDAYMIQGVPSDHMLHEAISSLLLRMGWKYVQIVTHGSGMYHVAAEDFMRTAGRNGICVVGMVDNLDSADAGRFDTALTRLQSRPDAAVVVVIADMSAVRGLLGAIQAKGSAGQLQLVAGTEAWAKNPEYVTGLETAAAGSLVVGLEMLEWQTFTTWLSSLSTSGIVGHPFLSELFEITNQCSLGPSTRGSYNRVCSSAETMNNGSLAGMDKIPYVIQSVYTMADKLHEVISDLCTPDYSGLCSSFRSSGDIGTLLDAKLNNTAKLANGYGIKDRKSSTNFVFSQYRNGANFMFAQYSNEDRQLVNFDMSQLTSVPAAPTCAGACVECQYLFALQTGVYYPGDWLVAGIFSVSNSGSQQYQPYVCGDIRTSNGPQYTTAMMYALQQVNSGKAPVSVKGVTFGGITLDHCNNPGRANLLASSVYSTSMHSIGLDEGKILSWLTDNTGASQEVEALLDPLGVSVVSPSATSMDLLEYSNFHRTIQGDQTVASALVKIIKSLGYPYFQVVYSDSGYGEGGLKVLQDVAQSEGVCITNSLKVSSAADADADGTVRALVASETNVVVFFTGTAHTRAVLQAIARNAAARDALFVVLAEPYDSIVKPLAPQMRHKIMSLQLQTGVLQGYNTFLDSAPVANPYFAQYYMKIMQCNLPGFSTYSTACPTDLQKITTATGYAPDNFILSTINAVYATVDALDRTIREYCGDDYTEPCREFLAAPDKRRRFNLNLDNVNFVDEAGNSFRFLDREGNVIYNVLQSTDQGDYKTVATYAGVSLDLEEADTGVYSSVVSECSPPCLSCVMQGLNFSHTPGDIYLAGVFDVHQSSVSPFTCGGINTLHGFLLLEAFHYALKEVNSKKGQFADILPGVNLGGIGIDACQSKIRGGYLVSNINNRFTTLARDGVVIDPSEIDAYIGSYGSRASIYLAQILNDLQIPQISFAAGNPDLSDERYYPYFYRTVPSDKNMVDAILKFLDTNDIRYVQVVFEDTFNAVATKEYFMERASTYRICVAQTVNYPDISTISDETATTVVSRLIEKPAANTVVTFLDTRLIAPMLRAVQRSERARGKLRFVGSDDWADNQEAIAGTGQQAIHSVTVKLDSDDVEGFERYINARSLANSDENPWFEEYYQAIHNCYVSKLNTMGYPNPCSLTLSDIINQPTYQQDQGVAYVMDAVYAAAFGLHETLKQKCGPSYTAVCQAYRNDQGRRELLKDNLEDVSFTDPLGANFQFVDRSGSYGYRYYAVSSGVLGVTTYNEIGTYNVTSGEISISQAYENAINSNCERKDTCTECPLIRDNSVRYATFNGPNIVPADATTVVAFFDIHKQGVDPYRCGDINPQGFQQYLAFFYTLEKVLKDTLDSQIRMVAIDTCSNPMRVDQDLYGLLAGDGLCNSQFDPSFTLGLGNLGAVITMGELNTMAAGRVLERPGVTYVSPNALSPMLDNNRHLVRSIAPTSAMMKALADLLSSLGMTYVDVVYENTQRSYHTMDRLDYYTYDARVCLGSSLAINEDDTDQDIETALAGLRGNLGSKAVILIGSHTFAKRILMAASRLRIADKYLWVLIGYWKPTPDAIASLNIGNNVKVLTVQRRWWEVQTFRNHMNQLVYSNVHAVGSRTNVPTQWYDEFYQLQFGCTLPNSERPLGGNRPVCNTTKTFGEVTWTPDPYVLNTVAAAYAVGAGLRNYLNLCPTCRSGGNLAPDMPARMALMDSILEVNWNMVEVFPNSDFHENRIDDTLDFDKQHRWWDQGHVFKAHWGSDPNTREFMAPVGSSELQRLRNMLGNFSMSKCSQNSLEGSCGCVFTEVQTPQAQQSMGYEPLDHRNYYDYNSAGDKTFEWPVWTIPVSILTCIGIIMTIILFLILICAYPVRGGTSVLGYMSIIGIMCIYGINFAFFMHATDAVCGIRRFLMGVVYMIALGPMLVKAVDNWRFSHVDQAEGRYSGISSACSLLMAAVGLVLIQCIVPIMWLILRHPTASLLMVEGQQMYGGRHDNWWCDPADDYDLGLVLSFGFVLFIVIITAGFSALAFDSGRNNFEARWILFSCVATGGCFLVWMVVTTNAGPPFRDPTVAIANVVNATLLMITMPLRKSILMCRARRAKAEDEDKSAVYNRNGTSYEYNGRYENPTYDMNYYDNTFMDSKSEEF